MKQKLLSAQTLSKQLIMTNVMEKALLALSMPAAELSQLVEDEIEKNPLLTLLAYSKFSAKQEFIEDIALSPVSLHSHLIKQAEETFSSKEYKCPIDGHLSDLEMAKEIIGMIDKKGFYQEDILFFSERKLEILNQIQDFDPIGVGSVSAKEALIKQLNERDKGNDKYCGCGYDCDCDKTDNKDHEIAKCILLFYYDDFLHRKLNSLSKKLQISKERIQQIIDNKIKPLTPFPGLIFSFSENQTLDSADVIIHVTNDDKIVYELNQFYPSFTLQIPKKLESESKPLKQYTDQAKLLQKMLEKRVQSLDAICSFLLKNQRSFLLRETHEPHPFTLQEISQETNLSISTISRILKNKTVELDRSIYPLKKLFPSKTKMVDSKQTTVSRESAKKLLLQMIQTEDKKKPYSDQILSNKIKDKGVLASRRTIAKYRAELQILPAKDRKKIY